MIANRTVAARSPSRIVLALLAGAVLAAGCSEKPQVLTGQGIRSDKDPSTGVGSSAFLARGWVEGDARSWAEHLRVRAQYGQNDYTRVP